MNLVQMESINITVYTYHMYDYTQNSQLANAFGRKMFIMNIKRNTTIKSLSNTKT